MSSLRGTIEALLFVADGPITSRKIAEFSRSSEKKVDKVLQDLIAEYQGEEHGFQLCEVAGGYRFKTKQQYEEVAEKLAGSSVIRRASQAALETLAIIAYKQPVTKGEIRAIRGVGSDSALNSLVDQGLVKESGRKDGPGQPIVYGTTSKFLQIFSLKTIRDLPPLEQFAPRNNGQVILQEESLSEESDPNK